MPAQALVRRTFEAHYRAMRMLLRSMAAALLVGGTPATADDGVVGLYRLEGVHDAAGELVVLADGRFEYALAYGALDERAQGHWLRHANGLDLMTEPKPVPPSFQPAPRGAQTPEAPTVRVAWPNGRGIAGVDLRIGFDSGDPVDAYTQEDGWRLPPDEHRALRWIELAEPIHGIRSARFAIDDAAQGTLNFVLVPNDIGVVDFSGMPVDVLPDRLVVHRGGGEMLFVRKGR